MAFVRWTVGTATRGTFIALILIGAVAACDYAAGQELSFSIFYAGPVLLGTWAAGRKTGITLAILSGIAFAFPETLWQSGPSGWISFWNFVVRAAMLVTVALLASMLQKTLRHERELARFDPMTDLPNARSFRERLQLECARLSRETSSLSIAFLDLDRFKSVNDSFGHEVGDRLLADFGAAMKDAVRSIDMVARLGGDEFGILLPETDESGAMRVVERLRSHVDRLGLQRMGAGFSLGLASFRYPHLTPDEAIGLADELMYEAKREGTNLVRSRTFEAPTARAKEEADRVLRLDPSSAIQLERR